VVLAGSRGMTGAARLCAAAALRGGAGLVSLGVPKTEQAVVARDARWEIMTLGLKSTPAGTFHAGAAKEALAFMKRRAVAAVALGPGLSVNPQTARFVKTLLTRAACPLVLDADGLNAVAARWPRKISTPLVLTPHPGEAARLLGTSTARVQADRPRAARALAMKTGGVCVLKGHRTLVSDGRRIFENPTGNPGLATGGAGDVLTGLIAALIGQVSGTTAREKTLRAALVGVYVHGLAGDLAARAKTRVSLAAGDLLDFLPRAFLKTFGARI